jgi:putative flippase GtrA
MKEFFQLLLKFDMKALFFSPTENGIIKFFRYCFVGGIAFIADYAAFAVVCLIFGKGSLVTAAGTTAGFIFGIIVNFILSKKFVFTENAKCSSKHGEFIWYTIIGIIGWVLNVLLMMVCTEWVFSINRYIAKIIVALIVLVYNYGARKVILYSK